MNHHQVFLFPGLERKIYILIQQLINAFEIPTQITELLADRFSDRQAFFVSALCDFLKIFSGRFAVSQRLLSVCCRDI